MAKRICKTLKLKGPNWTLFNEHWDDDHHHKNIESIVARIRPTGGPSDPLEPETRLLEVDTVYHVRFLVFPIDEAKPTKFRLDAFVDIVEDVNAHVGVHDGLVQLPEGESHAFYRIQVDAS